MKGILKVLFKCMSFYLVTTKCEGWAYFTYHSFFLYFLSILYKCNHHIILLKMLFIQIQNERVIEEGF